LSHSFVETRHFNKKKFINTIIPNHYIKTAVFCFNSDISEEEGVVSGSGDSDGTGEGSGVISGVTSGVGFGSGVASGVGLGVGSGFASDIDFCVGLGSLKL